MRRACFALLALAGACTTREQSRYSIAHAYVVPGAGLAPGVLYATIENETARADTITGIELDGATSVMLHGSEAGPSGATAMRMVHNVALPAHGAVRLAPGDMHGMIDGLRAGTARGDSLQVTVHFAHGAAVRAFARVVEYTDVDSLFTKGR